MGGTNPFYAFGIGLLAGAVLSLAFYKLYVKARLWMLAEEQTLAAKWSAVKTDIKK